MVGVLTVLIQLRIPDISRFLASSLQKLAKNIVVSVRLRVYTHEIASRITSFINVYLRGKESFERKFSLYRSIEVYMGNR